ncbi:MAG: hypothetical protein ACKOCQ_03335 [Candidatus Nitrosotenuis sp.]
MNKTMLFGIIAAIVVAGIISGVVFSLTKNPQEKTESVSNIANIPPINKRHL